MKYFVSAVLAAVASCSDTLNTGVSLFEGQSLTSQNGLYSAVLQTDGNFVVYRNPGNAWWSSVTDNA